LDKPGSNTMTAGRVSPLAFFTGFTGLCRRLPEWRV